MATPRAKPNPGRVLNYTTSIDPFKSVAEIQSILVAHGARRFSLVFDDKKQLEGMSFTLVVDEVERAFELKANWERVRERIIADHNKGKRSYSRGYWHNEPGTRRHTVPATVDDQAKRTAWRIMKDAVEVMVNLDKSGVADVSQVFFGFALLNSGTTIYAQFIESQRALPAP